ncbi:MAG TPA: PglZ domain-containing protein, partial [Acidimicrobiales bacterium]|nr:PglZ domain-containing protein [Acidimicrobiales bacterium]
AVTSDHGQVDVGTRARALDPRLAGEIEMASGEARFRWLHARSDVAGSVESLAALAGDIYGGEAWVATCDEIEAGGWFGGPLTPVVRARLGDVAVVPFEPVGYLAPSETAEPLLVCRHGSLTPEEMFVPLLGQRGRLAT